MHAINFFSILYMKKGGRLIRGSWIFSSYWGKNLGGRLIRAVDLYASIYGSQYMICQFITTWTIVWRTYLLLTGCFKWAGASRLNQLLIVVIVGSNVMQGSWSDYHYHCYPVQTRRFKASSLTAIIASKALKTSEWQYYINVTCPSGWCFIYIILSFRRL